MAKHQRIPCRVNHQHTLHYCYPKRGARQDARSNKNKTIIEYEVFAKILV